MAKNLYEECQSRGINTLKGLGDFISGRKLKTIKPDSGRSVSSHNYKAKIKCLNSITWSNNPFTATQVIGAGNSATICASTDGSTSIYIYELALDEESKADLQTELERITTKFTTEEKELKEKLQIMEDSGLDIYDEKLIKMIKVMGSLEFKKDSGMDKISLAKLLCNVE